MKLITFKGNYIQVGTRANVKHAGKYSPKLTGKWVAAKDDNDGTFRISQVDSNRYIEDFELIKVGTMVIKTLKINGHRKE